MEIKYFVERHLGDNEPISCGSEESCIAVAKQISGIAWKRELYHTKSGCPVNSFWRYSMENLIWEK